MPAVLDIMEPAAPARPTAVVNSPSAQFPGSFAVDLRYDHRKPAGKRDIKSIVKHYFTEGWNDISIWKSAVSTLFSQFLDEWQLHVHTSQLGTLRRLRRVAFL